MAVLMNDDHNWTTLAGELDARGWAMLPGLLDAETCSAIAAGYDDPAQFRSHVVMARHGFGRQSLARAARPADALSRRARGVPRAVPRSRPDAADAVAAALWARRL
jgi:hypothetical protein